MFQGSVTVTNPNGTYTIKANGSTAHFKCGEGTGLTWLDDMDSYVKVVADGRLFLKADVSVATNYGRK